MCVRLFYMSAAKQIACNDLCVNKRVGAQPWKDVAVRDMIVGLELNSCVMSSQNQEEEEAGESKPLPCSESTRQSWWWW